MEAVRPTIRADCLGGLRPCPWFGCQYNLAPEVFRREWRHLNRWWAKSRILRLWPGMSETCVLDVADKGAHTLDEVGNLLGLTRERVRQNEEEGLRQLGHSSRAKILRGCEKAPSEIVVREISNAS